MREIPSLGAGDAETKVGFAVHLSPPAVTSTSAAPYPSPAWEKCEVSSSCPWWPYSNSKDFKANTALVLVFLFCTLICAVAFNAAIRYMCARRRRQLRAPANRKEDLACATAEKEPEIPVLIYSEGMKLVECAICLSEFAIGERIRVLEKCSHGFHLQCIERWLVSHSSCPNCRANCL